MPWYQCTRNIYTIFNAGERSRSTRRCVDMPCGYIYIGDGGAAARSYMWITKLLLLACLGQALMPWYKCTRDIYTIFNAGERSRSTRRCVDMWGGLVDGGGGGEPVPVNYQPLLLECLTHALLPQYRYAQVYYIIFDEVDAHPSSVDNVCARGIHVVVVGAHVAQW